MASASMKSPGCGRAFTTHHAPSDPTPRPRASTMITMTVPERVRRVPDTGALLVARFGRDGVGRRTGGLVLERLGTRQPTAGGALVGGLVLDQDLAPDGEE